MILTKIYKCLRDFWISSSELRVLENKFYSRISQKEPNHPSWQLHSLADVQFPFTQPGKVRHSSQDSPVLEGNMKYISLDYDV